MRFARRYNLTLLLLNYVLPLLAIGCAYGAICRVLWSTRALGEHTVNQQENIRLKRKVRANKRGVRGVCVSLRSTFRRSIRTLPPVCQ